MAPREKKMANCKYVNKPDLDVARAIWNSIEMPIVKEVYKISISSIKVSKKLFVQRLTPRITEEYLELLNSGRAALESPRKKRLGEDGTSERKYHLREKQFRYEKEV